MQEVTVGQIFSYFFPDIQYVVYVPDKTAGVNIAQNEYIRATRKVVVKKRNVN